MRQWLGLDVIVGLLLEEPRMKLASVIGTFICSTLVAVCAHGDPITIGSGSVTLGGFGRGVFRTVLIDVQGEGGFALNGQNSDVNTGVVPSCNQFDPCDPADTVLLTETFIYANA